MKTLQNLVALVMAVSLTSLSTHAATEVDASSNPLLPGEFQFDHDIAQSNLLYNRPITSTQTPDDGFALTGINNGAASQNSGSDQTFFDGNGAFGTTLLSDPVVTISLNTVASPNGYTLSEIQTIDGWQNYDQSWSDQSYSVYYSTVTAPLTFKLLAVVNYHPFVNDPDSNFDTDQRDVASSSEVTLTNLTGAKNVAALEFVLSPSFAAGNTDESDGVIIREFQAFGTETPVPEPSTWALMGLACLALVWRMRSRRSIM